MGAGSLPERFDRSLRLPSGEPGEAERVQGAAVAGRIASLGQLDRPLERPRRLVELAEREQRGAELARSRSLLRACEQSCRALEAYGGTSRIVLAPDEAEIEERSSKLLLEARALEELGRALERSLRSLQLTDQAQRCAWSVSWRLRRLRSSARPSSSSARASSRSLELRSSISASSGASTIRLVPPYASSARQLCSQARRRLRLRASSAPRCSRSASSTRRRGRSSGRSSWPSEAMRPATAAP